MSPSKLSRRKWRYTWEAQDRSPNLKLFLFDSQTRPSLHCPDLRVELLLPKSRLLVTWTAHSQNGVGGEVVSSLEVPVPKVLIDPEAPVHSRPLDDHIEVKLLLLLPVDHPLLSTFDSDFATDGDCNGAASGTTPRSSESGVQFYCKSCEGALTTAPIRRFVEMPSVNWRELADNWFGGCCCSFGGAGEKLVDRYVDAYTCTEGVCYLSSSAVSLFKDDLVGGSQFACLDCDDEDVCRQAVAGVDTVEKEKEAGVAAESCCEGPASCDCESLEMNELQERTRLLVCTENGGRKDGVEESKDPSEHMALKTGCCGSACHSGVDFEEVDGYTVLEPSLLKADQRSFLNGFLGDGFITRSQNISTDIKWKQFTCPMCSALLGVCPCSGEGAVVDNGVRLFKCNVATSLPVGGPEDLFREYTLDRMLSDQLVENEKDELSFRTLVRDLETRFPVLRIVSINSSSWQCTGFCLDSNSRSDIPLKSNLQPVVKVLYSACSGNGESSTRALEDWLTKHQPDEFFMTRGLVEKLMESLASAKDVLPGSCTAVQGFTLSSLQR